MKVQKSSFENAKLLIVKLPTITRSFGNNIPLIFLPFFALVGCNKGGYAVSLETRRYIPHECLIGRPSLIPRRVKRFAASVVLKETWTIGLSGPQTLKELRAHRPFHS